MVVGPTGADSFADNIGDTLRRMGHDVLMAGPARHRLKSVRAANAVSIFAERLPRIDARMQQHLIRSAESYAPDVVLTVQHTLLPSTVTTLKNAGARVVLWFPDAVSNLGRHSVFLAPYDLLLFKNPSLVKQLRDVHGLPAVYMPEAANSVWHRSDEAYGLDKTILVAGNIHPTRSILLKRLIDAGLPLTLYGSPPAAWINAPWVTKVHTGRYIARQEKADLFRRARVVLNNLHPAELSGTNARLFEAAASGAAVLTEEREGLSELFLPGEEVLTFSTFDSLVTQANTLLTDASAGQHIGDRAAARAHRDHVYERRLDDILTLAG